MLILAFDTATEVACSALVDDGEVLGERASVAGRVLEDIDALLRQASSRPADVDAIAVGVGPGSFTSTRIGLAVARGLALALDVPVAGVSTLDALAAAADDLYPVVDARRGEVFVRDADGARTARPEDVRPGAGSVCVGDGARRYREALEAAGATVPPDESPLHRPQARYHAMLASSFGPAELVEPLYVRVPDVDQPRS
jgi:tRNA threonylcarbamoyladenosine biosynthesis protein TsaB